MNRKTIRAVARSLARHRDDLLGCAEKLGIRVVFSDTSPSGIAFCAEDSWFVVVNGAERSTRGRFTLAHEIGHVVVAKMAGKQGAFYLNGCSPEEERLANLFATELLMPEGEVRQAVDEGLTLEELAEFFEVSKQAAKIRLEELGLLERAKQNELTSLHG